MGRGRAAVPPAGRGPGPPAGESETALARVLEALGPELGGLEARLLSLASLGGVEFGMETFDLADIVDVELSGAPTAAPARRIAADAFDSADMVTAEPTGAPTRSPTETDVTTHPIRLTLRNVPSGYSPDEAERGLILEFATERLEAGLGDGLELIGVEYAGQFEGARRRSLGRSRGWRRLKTAVLPLRVTVRGPRDVSDVALAYVLDILRPALDDLAALLRDNAGDDSDVYDNVELRVDAYEPADREGKVKAQDAGEAEPVMQEAKGNFPWWAWFIIALAIVLLCACCFCFYEHGGRKGDDKQRQAVSMWMQNGYEDSHGSQASSVEAWKRRRRRHLRGDVPVQEGERGGRACRPAPRPVRRPPVRRKSRTEIEEEERGRGGGGDVPAAPVPFVYRQRLRRPEDDASPFSRRRHRRVGDDPSHHAPRDRPDNGPRRSHRRSEDSELDYEKAQEEMGLSGMISVDPPEENVPVVRDRRGDLPEDDRPRRPHRKRRRPGDARPRSTDPEGPKVPKKASVFASEVCYGRSEADVYAAAFLR